MASGRSSLALSRRAILGGAALLPVLPRLGFAASTFPRSFTWGVSTSAAQIEGAAEIDGKAPSITVPKTAAPKQLVSDYVIEGGGAPVKATDQVLVQYQGVVWSTGKKFDSTYDHGQLATIALSQINFKGLTQGLTGKKVGSRVLLVIPPALGYGSQANQAVPANSTLVFAVDILATL